MPDIIDQDEEPEEVGVPERTHVKGARKSFSGVRRELSDDELKTPAVQKFLLDELERLEGELSEAKGFQSRYYSADKKVGIFEQKFKTYTAVEILSTVTLAAGSIIIGYVPGIWSNQPTSGIFLAVGVLLFVGGLVAKVVKL